ncbi:MAG: hypothetical protein LBU50_05555 [Cellulomonas sp.]|jgi:hypothetical protein|nr:hypothetical protein [Cellulomonas sp.]
MTSGLTYSMLFPRGWQRFGVDAAGERRVIAAATRQARDAGRADVVAMIRQYTRQMFDRLRQQRAIEVHLPVGMPTTAPASLAVVPLVAGERTFDAAVARAARGLTVERLDVDDTIWYRWVEPHSRVEDSAELTGTTLHYVIPRPGGPGEAGLHLAFTAIGLVGDEEVQQWIELGHTIVGSFQWQVRETAGP